VFVPGCPFILVSMLGLGGMIVKGIRRSLRAAITVGIGLFLALIALKSAGIVVDSEPTLVKVGDLHKSEALMAIFGFLLVVTLTGCASRARS
jgi:AGZA family xanthine/uracil permease-like MFS transporter